MVKIILLNGPPSSGKDTAAKHIREFYHNDCATFAPNKGPHICILDRMSMPIKRAFAGMMSAPISEDGEVQPWEAEKEINIPLFNVSYRQWQIDFSEKFLKPLYGERVFGNLIVSRINRRFEKGIANLIVIPDCGFQCEIDVLYSWFDPKDILLVRCHRPGFTFQGDSRSYVKAPKGCAVFDPINQLQHEYLAQIEAGVACWLQTPERMAREQS